MSIVQIYFIGVAVFFLFSTIVMYFFGAYNDKIYFLMDAIIFLFFALFWPVAIPYIIFEFLIDCIHFKWGDK